MSLAAAHQEIGKDSELHCQGGLDGIDSIIDTTSAPRVSRILLRRGSSGSDVHFGRARERSQRTPLDTGNGAAGSRGQVPGRSSYTPIDGGSSVFQRRIFELQGIHIEASKLERKLNNRQEKLEKSKKNTPLVPSTFTSTSTNATMDKRVAMWR